MYDGISGNGPAGVRAFILRHQDQYVRNVAQNLMTYAVGRGMDYEDMPEMRSIVRAAAKDNYRFKGLIEAVAASDLFRMNVATGDTRVEEDAPPRSGMLTAPARALARAGE